jgi:hypothetical protein
MFPKLIKNAKIEDVQKENPELYASMTKEITDKLTAELSAKADATLQVTHKEIVESLNTKITELETNLSLVSSNLAILNFGVENKQAELAISLIKESKSETEALATISSAKSAKDNFKASAPPAAGSGSSSDSQTIETQAAAIDAVMKIHPETSRANAVRLARREYPSLFVSPSLLNHNGKR